VVDFPHPSHGKPQTGAQMDSFSGGSKVVAAQWCYRGCGATPGHAGHAGRAGLTRSIWL